MATAGPVLFGIGNSPEPYPQHHKGYNIMYYTCTYVNIVIDLRAIVDVVLFILKHRDETHNVQ